MVIPGLLRISRRADSRNLRSLGMSTNVVIVLLMWSECFRLALHRVLELPGVPAIAAQLGIYFWLARELGWWWAISVMLAILCYFIWEAPIVQAMVSDLHRWVVTRNPLLAPAWARPNDKHANSTGSASS